MSSIQTIRDLKVLLQQKKVSWTVNAKLQDSDKIPTYHLGVKNPKKATEAAKLNFADVLNSETTNPILVQRRIIRGGHGAAGVTKIINPQTNQVLDVIQAAGPQTRPGAIDWRNRWGINWITKIRDQNRCENCWAFGTTALIESMVRINHSVWCIRSEGDLRDGMGLHCADGGWPSTALDWIKSNGIADPDCWPFDITDVAYAPTPDRSGRTVKIDGYTSLGNMDDEKNWLDAVGPITCCFAVYQDFYAYGGGVYTQTSTNFEGLHCVLIVGYDDTQNCWIAKNSWGQNWGENGYFRISYGQCDIDNYQKYGFNVPNPDPWTKRRLHSGNIIESGDGDLHRNFEMVATANGTQVQHWWRDNGSGGATSGYPWAKAELFANDAAVCPTFTGTTYNRNFELVYRTTGNRLHHWFFDQTSKSWGDGGIFGPTDATGIPCFIQSNYGAPGNFEVVVSTADGKLNHWWRMNAPPFTWTDGGRFASNISQSGATLIQSAFGSKGNLELVALLNDGTMQHWWRDDDATTLSWNPGPIFGTNITSPPCMIQGQYGATDEYTNGNFELCVAVGGKIQHWWRNNSAAGLPWANSTIFGPQSGKIQAVTGLIESSFGFNLEVIALREDRQLQHFWRDGAGWHEGPIIGPA
jgi:C1A family cysteine protease